MERTLSEDCQALLTFYRKVIDHDTAEFEDERRKIIIPVIPEFLLTNICTEVAKIFANEQILLRINKNCIIVGDLHGHLLDLYRIFSRFGMPPNQTYFFLGDYVDRGEFSTETISLLFILKILYPENIYMIRGNHEFEDMCHRCGFSSELAKLYPSQIVEQSFFSAFSYMPFAAVIDNRLLCVHGGIGPTLTSIQAIADLKRPIADYNTEPILSLVWSDPLDNVQGFQKSSRGLGFYFGPTVLESLLKNNSLQLLIRGHECISTGVEPSLNRMALTVFSASNYCGLSPNLAGVLIVKKDQKPDTVIMQPLKHPKRSNSIFIYSESDKSFIIRKIKPTPLPKNIELHSIKPPSMNHRSIDINTFHNSKIAQSNPYFISKCSTQPLRDGRTASLELASKPTLAETRPNLLGSTAARPRRNSLKILPKL